MSFFTVVSTLTKADTLGTTKTGTYTLTAQSTASDIIYIATILPNGFAGISDNLGNSWVELVGFGNYALLFCYPAIAGTATITITQAGTATGGDRCFFAVELDNSQSNSWIAEYSAPYLNNYVSPWVTTNTTYVTGQSFIIYEGIGFYDKNILVVGFNTNTGSNWTLSTGALLGTAGTGSAWITLGTYDSVNNSSGYNAITTLTQTTTGTKFYFSWMIGSFKPLWPPQHDMEGGFNG